MWQLALGLAYGITSLPLNRLVGHTMTTESWARNVQKCIDIRIISITTLSAYLQSYLVNDQPRSWPVRLMCRNDNDAEHKGEYDYRTKTTKQRASNNGIPFFSCFVNFGREMGTVDSRFSFSPGASTTTIFSFSGGIDSKCSQASSNMMASSPFLKLILSSSYSANSGNPL